MTGDADSAADNDDSRINVFLRLRPMNALETSKRSKDCIELDEDPSKITVEAPLQGLFRFSFSHVFDEYATQEELYNGSRLFEISDKLLSGHDCCILVYGQTGTGKSHLVLGPVAELPNDTISDAHGVIPRITRDLFQAIETKVPVSTECIIKVSMLELYLERWTDLLHPIGTIWVDANSQIQGASELCCLHPRDVYQALLRGSLQRTQSATQQNLDATRSHVITQLRVEQIDRSTNIVRSANLRVVDLAGSEQLQTRMSRKSVGPLAHERRMASASLQSLCYFVSAKVAVQQGKTSRPRTYPCKEYANVSKLTRLLKSSLEGPSCTIVFLTASASSYNIAETLNTLEFGCKLQNLTLEPNGSCSRINEIPIWNYPLLLKQFQLRIDNLTQFVRLLAVECRTIRKTGKIKQPHSVWDIISAIAKSSRDVDCDASDLLISVTRKSQERVTEAKDDAALLENLKNAEAARDRAESALRDQQSQVLSLRAEVEWLKKEKLRLEEDLQKSKEEVEQLNKTKMATYEELRTTQFREHEAVVFLRQFRTFYLRLLKSKASLGNGDVDEVVSEASHQMPGITGLKAMLDVDRLLIQSGLIESQEYGNDTNNNDYIPSVEAAQKSIIEAEQAAERAMQFLNANGMNKAAGHVIEYHQKLVETPAGRLALQATKDLESGMHDLFSKCTNLQNTLTVERAMVEALSARQGALGKMKAAQEIHTIKSELERRTNDLHAIIWKMNELHVVNSTLHEKLENREISIASLEEHLARLHETYQQLLVDKQHECKKLREQNTACRTMLESNGVKLWQLGEDQPKNPLKLIIPVTGKPIDVGLCERRISLEDIADEGIELLEPLREKVTTASVSTQSDPEPVRTATETATQTDPEPVCTVIDTEAQTDDVVLHVDDAEVQTDPVCVMDLETANAYGPKESMDVSLQTDLAGSDVRTHVPQGEIGVQTIPILHHEIGIQTNESLPFEEIGVSDIKTRTVDEMIDVSTRTMADSCVQTEQEHTAICFEASTQTDDHNADVTQLFDESIISAASVDEDDVQQRSQRPPKPPQMDKSPRFDTHRNSSNNSKKDNKIEEMESLSQTSFSSVGSATGSGILSEKLGSSMKWNLSSGSLSNQFEGQSDVGMSTAPLHTSKTLDRRVKGQGKVEETTSSVSLPGAQVSKKFKVPTTPKKVDNARQMTTKDVPEWMVKFKEMGIKGDDVDDAPVEKVRVEEPAPARVPVVRLSVEKPFIPSSPPAEKPAWMKKLKSPKVLDKSNSMDDEENLPVPPWEKLRRRSSMGAVPDKALKMNVALEVGTSSTSKEPEWTRRSKYVDVKGPDEEQIQQVNVQEEGDDEEDHAKTPEWVQKFKQIGQKGEEKVI